ncbi:hypothetical protein [Verrucomicrobium spinosum]|uniref:hypothetical protein n=1 Tax=Verrucomicrobium spinosum TaxID=2736 RepID=UPI0009E8BF4F|nr:hypothetical protein [Verrucomicrobium spinosum]
MQDIQTHIGNRSVGGRFVSWLKNKDGITPKEQRYMNSFQKALTDKLGSREAVNVLFKELQLSPDRPLSVRKMQVAMDTADQMVADRDSYTAARDKQVATKLANDQKTAAAVAAAKAKAAKEGRGYVPLVAKVNTSDTPDKALSPSAAALRSSISTKLSGTPDENLKASRAIINSLGLKDNEEVTDAHIATANKLAQRYEESRGSALYNDMGDKTFAKYFEAAFTNIVANGWDNRADLLSTDELVALNAYTQIDYATINKQLRDGDPSPLTQTITNLCLQGWASCLPTMAPFQEAPTCLGQRSKLCPRRHHDGQGLHQHLCHKVVRGQSPVFHHQPRRAGRQLSLQVP